MNCDALSEVAAGYVLDSLESAEAAAFESHLRQCDGCQWLVRELGETVELLAGVAVPRPELRERILEAARRKTPL